MHDAPPAADEALLHRWQACLLALLRAGGEPAAIRAALLADPTLAPLHAYAAGLDLHALAVAVELVARWGSSAEHWPQDDRDAQPSGSGRVTPSGAAR